MKHKRLFKILTMIEDTIAFSLIVIGSIMTICQSADLKQQIIINLIGMAIFTIGILDIKK